MGEFKINYSSYFKPLQEDDFASYYDQVDIVDFSYSEDAGVFTYPCPCGDLFCISLDDLRNGETLARCNSCSLIVFVVYGEKDLEKYAGHGSPG